MKRRLKTQVDTYQNYRRCRARSGLTMTEIVISSILLVTVMSFVTSLYFHVNSVWKDITHRQVAVGELSNQLESLTVLPASEIESAIEDLSASDECQTVLRQAELSGELIKDELGTRVVLNINWNRRFPGKPVQLSGWLIPTPPVSTQESQP